MQLEEALESLNEARDLLEVFVDEEIGGTGTEVEQLAQVLRSTCGFAGLLRTAETYEACDDAIVWSRRLVEQRDVPFSRLILATALTDATFASLESDALSPASEWIDEAVSISCDALQESEVLAEGPSACARALSTRAELRHQQGDITGVEDDLRLALSVLESASNDLLGTGEYWYVQTLLGRTLSSSDPTAATASIVEGIEGAFDGLQLDATNQLASLSLMVVPACRVLTDLGSPELAQAYLQRLTEALGAFAEQAELPMLQAMRADALVQLAALTATTDIASSGDYASQALAIFESLEAGRALLDRERILLEQARTLASSP